MYGQISTVAFVGIEARPVEVQVQITSGAYAFAVVGLPDKAVAESRERVRNALHSTGLGMPWKHITVNLSPADLPKEGSHFDLPIALALMVAMGAISPDAIQGFSALGELSLDGSIRAVPGMLPAAIGANADGKNLICPESCGAEAAWASEDMNILAAPHLLSLVNHFKGLQTLRRPEPNLEQEELFLPDLRDVKGQESAKRALEIAAAGGHNLLMVGPPGSGKSMLASRLPSILPPLSIEEMLEVSMIHSLSGDLSGGKLATARPFREPHHSASMAALVGGGSRPRPGEVAMAHLGVLFLDELPEFSSQALDALRQPMESGISVIARANHRVSYPARFQLIGAMNPCKCGGGGPGQSCKRGPSCAAHYQSRISGPFLDRMDMQIEVPAVTAADLVLPEPSEGSAQVRARVIAARDVQRKRLQALEGPPTGAGRAGPAKRGMSGLQQRLEAKTSGKTYSLKGIRCNADCKGSLLDKIATPDDEAMGLLRSAAERLNLTARGFHRCLRVASTIADLDGSETVGRDQIAEALSYRAELGQGSRPCERSVAPMQAGGQAAA